MQKESDEEIIKKHKGLVVSLAKKYVSSNMKNLLQYNTELEDLIQEGNKGLLVAKARYKKGKFSTYAYWWIKHFITRYINECCRDIRFPNHKKLKDIYTLKVHALFKPTFTGDDTFYDIIPNKNDNLDEVEFKFDLEITMEKLSSIERDILIMRLQGHTYRDIGKYFNLSKQRINQKAKKIKELLINN
jgi:RNA polymerase sigma factor (sigma-70 family)